MITVLGWVGAICVLLAWYMVTKHGHSWQSYALNVLGSGALIVSFGAAAAWFGVALNVAWIVISLWGWRRWLNPIEPDWS